MRRFVLIVTAISIALIMAPVAHASSVYDNVIKNGGQIKINNTYASSICNGSSNDLASSWAGIVTDPTKYASGYNAAGQISNTAQVITAFNAALDAGKGWAVVQEFAPSNGVSPGGSSESLALGNSFISVYFSNNGTAVFQSGYSGYELAMQGSWYRLDIYYVNHSGTCEPNVVVGFHNTSNWFGVEGIQTDGNTNEKNAFINFDISYPSGYAGVKPRDTFTPPNNIQFVWGVDENGVVTATYTQNLPPEQDDILKHCGITWELKNSDSSWAPGTTIDTTTQERTLTYRYDHITPGFYQLTSKPNWCTPYIDDGSVTPTTVNIPFNGSFVGSTSNSGGTSQGPFVIQSTILNQYGLTQAVQAPLNAIKRLVGTSCSSITLPIWSGSTIVLPCMSTFYSNVSVLYGIWQVTITGVVAYWFSIKSFHHIRGLLNPNNDAIATVDL